MGRRLVRRWLESSVASVRDGAPQVEYEFVAEAEFVDLGVRDGLDELVRILVVAAELPDGLGQLRVVYAHERLEQAVYLGHCQINRLVLLKIIFCFV